MHFKFKKKQARLVYKSTLKCDFNESFEVAFALEDKSPSKGRVKTNPNAHSTERNLFIYNLKLRYLILNRILIIILIFSRIKYTMIIII